MILLLGVMAGVTAVLFILFRRLGLREKVRPKMQWWTPAVLVILFVLIGVCIVRFSGLLDPHEDHLFLTHGIEGAYLGAWLASVPVFSPNARWDHKK